MNKDWQYYLGLGLLAAILFIPFIGRMHLFDWDEINFAECAREMIVSGDYLTVQIFYEPFWEKPPLFIWMQVLSMKVFGINEFAARFPNALGGVITLMLLFYMGRKLKNRRFGLYWALAYLVSFLPFIYFKSGIIDPWFNLFILLAVFHWVQMMNMSIQSDKSRMVLLSGVFLGLAVLTKGPAALAIFGLTIGFLVLFNRFKFQCYFYHIILFLVSFVFVGGFWFLLQLLSGNGDVIVDFIQYQIRLFTTRDAGHGGFPLYHFVVLLFGVFPASVFGIVGHKRFTQAEPPFALMRKAMLILFWVVLILFSIVKTKIVHYSSMCYFPLTFLAAYTIDNLIERRARVSILMKILLIIVGSVPTLVAIGIPFFDKYKSIVVEKGLITHSFTLGNLQAETGWTLYHSLVGIILLFGLIWFFIFQKREKIKCALVGLGSSSLLFVTLLIIFFAPGVERMSQNAAIEFIKEKSQEDAYMQTFYKSYALLFYSNAPLPAHNKVFSESWLGKGDIDKKAYFVMRIDKQATIERIYPEVEIMFEKNGYVFGVRYPKHEEIIEPEIQEDDKE